jgi:hypothetical protein
MTVVLHSMTISLNSFKFLDFFDVIVDHVGVPELLVSVDRPVEEVVVVVVLAVSLNLEQVSVGLLVLADVVVPGNLKLRRVEVDSLLKKKMVEELLKWFVVG